MRITEIGEERGSDIARKYEGVEITDITDSELLLILRKGKLRLALWRALRAELERRKKLRLRSSRRGQTIYTEREVF